MKKKTPSIFQNITTDDIIKRREQEQKELGDLTRLKKYKRNGINTEEGLFNMFLFDKPLSDNFIESIQKKKN
jgi:hypothetical protein